MKVLYFFDILEGNLMKLYLKFKKKEVREIIKHLRQVNKGILLSVYCLNKGNNYLSSINFSENINSVLTEYFNIEKKTYNNLVNTVWSNVRIFFKNLTKNRFKVLNYFWNILEYRITTKVMGIFEKLEFIKSIIIRENPDIIYFSEKDRFFYEFLKRELNLIDVKIIFLKSQINSIYHKINNFLVVMHKFINYLKYDYVGLKSALVRTFRKENQKKDNNQCYIAISAPGNYYYSKELSSLTTQLKKNRIKYDLFRNVYDIPPTFQKIKFKWALLFYIEFNIKHLFKKSRNKNEIVKYIRPSLKEFAFFMLRDTFFYEIKKMIYIIKAFTLKIESSNYKVFIMINEFGAPGKIAYYVASKHGIPVYFIPYCGIPRRESDVTPYLSDFICVDGELDKEYLTNKGVNSKKIHIRGSPKYENILNKKVNSLNEIQDHFTGKIHPLLKNKHKILLATNFFADEANWILLSSVVNTLKKFNEIQFIIKLHPSQDGLFIRDSLKKLVYEGVIVKDVNIFDLIKSVDIFLTEESSVILDAMVVGTPIICLDFSNKGVYFSGKHVYNDDRYLIIVQDQEKLYQKLKELLSSQEKIKKYKKSIKDNLKLFLYHEKDYSPTLKIISDLKKFF